MKPTDEQWIRCPICGAKTRARLLPDTVLRNFPLFCPKCRQESIINAQNYHTHFNYAFYSLPLPSWYIRVFYGIVFSEGGGTT